MIARILPGSQPVGPAVSLSGDGGFTMLMGGLLSLKQLGLPVKVVVFNNGALGFSELEQKSSGFVDSGTKLQNPDFAAMAEAVGIKGVRITDPSEAESKLAEALAHPGPLVIDAVVTRMALAMPPKVTAEMAKGFTLYMWSLRAPTCSAEPAASSGACAGNPGRLGNPRVAPALL